MTALATVWMLIWVYYVSETDTTYMTYGADFSTMEDCEEFGALNFSEWRKTGQPTSRANLLCVEVPNPSGKVPRDFPDRDI